MKYLAPNLKKSRGSRRSLGGGVVAFMVATVSVCTVGCGGVGPLRGQNSTSEAVAAPQSLEGSRVDTARRPRLVIWLTVDQMRADYLTKYEKNFAADGFRRLLAEGVSFEQAYYAHAITETAPGHATLFTGVSPKGHGIVGNNWLVAGREVTSVADETETLLGPGVEKTAPGASARKLAVSTVGDALLDATQEKAKVFAISGKDRGAVLPAGKKGKALWLGPHGFITSSYHYPQGAPKWLTLHHEKHPPADYIGEGWSLLLPESAYDNPEATGPVIQKEWGLGFPRKLTRGARVDQALLHSPFADQAVLDLAQTVLEEEQLGRDDVPDLLALSLSATDLIGHVFGPETREMEDQILHLDRALGAFLKAVDAALGKESYLVVLSADHGGTESTEFKLRHGLPGGELTEPELETRVKAALQKKYGHSRFFKGVVSPSVFLDHAAIEKAGVALSDVRALGMRALAEMPKVACAYSQEEGITGLAGDTAARETLLAQLGESIFPGRSGDIYVVPKEHTLFMQHEGMASTHGSPWSYDGHVPIVISGGAFAKGRNGASSGGTVVSERVDVRSLAPTVGTWLGLRFQSGLDPLGAARFSTAE